MNRDKFVLDTSVIVDGSITAEVKSGKFRGAIFIVPEVVLAELEGWAARGQETGYAGLAELKQLQNLHWEGEIELSYQGEQLKRIAQESQISALVRQIAEEENAVLITSDKVQAQVCEAKGIPVRFYQSPAEERSIELMKLLQYFDEKTMSVHLRAGIRPKAKRGTPGHMQILYISEEPLTVNEVEQMAQEIVEVAKSRHDGFIEMDSSGSTVVQLKNLRIAIARPPFADALEITAVRPVAKTKLDDYAHADLLKERLKEKHRGALISGAPGAGKSTLVQAIADYLEEAGWVIKTMERPRDLEVSEEITQYTALEGDMANTADVLLLVRPDYTIFDEMRRTPDFQVFADMRLAGVGMIGVVHATRGIDALQRLIGRVELGMIPQVVDTVVYVEAGDIKDVYEVDFTVKVPSGMGDEDLARPVIEVRDFDSKELQYEIYSFGEQVVVMPVREAGKKPVWELAARELEYELSRIVRGSTVVEMVSDSKAIVYVDEDQRPYILGRAGSRIAEIEEQVGLRIDVRSFAEMDSRLGREVQVTVSERHIILDLDPSLRGKDIEIVVNGEAVLRGSVSRSGSIKLVRGSEPAERIYEAYLAGSPIRARRTGS